MSALKELVKKIYEKTESRLGANTGKIVTFILFGILLLVVVIPVDGCGQTDKESDSDTADNDYVSDDSYVSELFASETFSSVMDDGTAGVQSINDGAEYYETRLKNILETSYGEGSVQVMIHMTKDSEKGLYGDVSEENIIDGVLIIADVQNAGELLEISEAVCALFNLPACKVYVIKKS